jgi:hypothetical protein
MVFVVAGTGALAGYNPPAESWSRGGRIKREAKQPEEGRGEARRYKKGEIEFFNTLPS